MMHKPIHPKDLDISSITYKHPKDLPNGGKKVYMDFENSPIIIQTPKLFCPFGLKDWKGNHSYTLDLSFKGMETDPKILEFYDKLTELDEKIIEDCQGNGMAWLKKPIENRDEAEMVYTRQIRVAKDKNGEVDLRFPNTIKLNVPYRDGYFIPDVYDSASREQIDLHDRDVDTKGAMIIAIIQCTGVWTAGGKCGLGWKVMQMIVEPPVVGKRQFAFIDMD